MKKIVMMTSMFAVLGTSAIAETRWFVGGDSGYASPVMSDTLEDLVDEDFLKENNGSVSVSLIGGMRFGDVDKVYNGGVSVKLSYMPDIISVKDGSELPYYLDGELDFTTLYVSYDNYVRLSGDEKYRTDLVASIGLGYGWIEETVHVDGYVPVSLDDDGMLVSFRLGVEKETVVEGLSLQAGFNVIALNADDDADLQGSFGFDFGVKYTF